MANNKEGTIVTRRGLQLIAKATAGVVQINFSRVKVGVGILPSETDPSELTHLINYKMDGMIAEYGYDEEAKDAYVVMQITNTSIESGFVMIEIGLYAEDPDLGEILFAYVDLSNDPNHIMPLENGRLKTVQAKLHVFVGEVTTIHAVVNPSSQLTRAEFDRRIREIEEDLGERLKELEKGFGQVIIGAENTPLNINDTLFIVDGMPDPPIEEEFEGAFFENMVFSPTEPLSAENWGRTEKWAAIRASPYAADARTASETDGEPSIIKGKLVVSENPSSDATFFAKIEKE